MSRHIPQIITQEQAHALHHKGAFNQAMAVFLTKRVGTMSTAYSFVVLAWIGLAGIVGWLPPVALILVAWFSQTFLQLVLLPVLAVGSNVLSKQAELQSQEQFRMTSQVYQDMEQMQRLLDAIGKRLGIVPCPYPPALIDKLKRIGFTSPWMPTPGVSDEDKELYISIDANTHLYFMPVDEALKLSDDNFKIALEVLLDDDDLKHAAQAEYERRKVAGQG